MPTLLLPEHLKGLCSLAAAQTGDADGAFSHGVQELLADAAAASPLLFVGLHESCTQLLEVGTAVTLHSSWRLYPHLLLLVVGLRKSCTQLSEIEALLWAALCLELQHRSGL